MLFFELGYQTVSVGRGVVIASLIIALAIVIAFYLLKSIAIYKMAVNAKIKKAYIAFIPFVWIFIACKLIGNVRFFFDSFSKMALLITIVFTIGEVLAFAYSFFYYFPRIGYYLQGGEILIEDGIIYASNMANPFDIKAINIIMNILVYVNGIFELINTVIIIFVYINLFRKYCPQNYILLSVLSVLLGIFAPLIFAVRNNRPINYAEYIRNRYTYYSNPYGPNQYGRNESEGRDDPFENFNDGANGRPKDADPFPEFKDDNKR